MYLKMYWDKKNEKSEKKMFYRHVDKSESEIAMSMTRSSSVTQNLIIRKKKVKLNEMIRKEEHILIAPDD